MNPDVRRNPMRLLIALSICLPACSTQTPLTANRCPVLGTGGGNLDAVEIGEELERDLLLQLPSGDRSDLYCWYQTPTETLEAHHPILEFGYVFVRRDGEWRVVRRVEHLSVREAFP